MNRKIRKIGTSPHCSRSGKAFLWHEQLQTNCIWLDLDGIWLYLMAWVRLFFVHALQPTQMQICWRQKLKHGQSFGEIEIQNRIFQVLETAMIQIVSFCFCQNRILLSPWKCIFPWIFSYHVKNATGKTRQTLKYKIWRFLTIFLFQWFGVFIQMDFQIYPFCQNILS